MGSLAITASRLFAHGRSALKEELQHHLRIVAVRAGFVAVAAALALVCALMGALALYYVLSEQFQPAPAAAITAAVFLVLAIISLFAGFKLAFRKRHDRAVPTQTIGNIDDLSDDVANLSSDVHGLISKNGSGLFLAALAAGVAVSVLKDRR